MSSIEVAYLTNKQHRDVLKAIRNMEDAWEKVNGRKFALVGYTDAKGENRPMYDLSKTECLYIATKFNDEARARLIIRWEALERNNVPTLPMTEIKELISLKFAELIELNAKQSADMVKQSADIAELKALLDQRIIRSNRPDPREESALSQQEKDQIAAFWDALNESKSFLLKKEHWTVDHEYLFLSMAKVLPYYEPHCIRHGLEFINAPDLKDVLLSGRYAPYVASTQKGLHNSHNKAGFGRCYRFRYEVRDRELFIGDKKITFARIQ